MKKDKEQRTNLLLIIFAPISTVAGIPFLVIPIENVQRSMRIMFGGLLVLLGLFLFSLWLIRILAMRSIEKDKLKEQKKLDEARTKRLNDLINKFENAVDLPKPNTIKLFDAGMIFDVEGRYVCEKDFKGKLGHHLAFEVTSTGLKYKPEDYDDACDLESHGILISVGYHDGEALEEYANDNGVILEDLPKNLIGRTVTLKLLDGYKFDIWTAEDDDIDCGVMKILECENDVLTVHFMLSVFGLCDTVEGVVRLKKEPSKDARDIQSLITRTKWRRYNTLDVSAETIAEIQQANAFLPESYIEFLREIGFADMNWIDVGFYNKTPTNLCGDSATVKFFLEYKEYNVSDYYFIAIDNNNGLYAFSRNPDDKKVYAFSCDIPHVTIYDSFEEFLATILDP